MCKLILCVKLRCKKSSFAENYRYLSWKYNFSDCDWFTNIAYLMGKVKIKQLLLYPVSHDAFVLHDLRSMRDNGFCGVFITAQLINNCYLLLSVCIFAFIILYLLSCIVTFDIISCN